jgi:hypothetical protein
MRTRGWVFYVDGAGSGALQPSDRRSPVGPQPRVDRWPPTRPACWQPGDATDPTGQNRATQIGIAGAIEEFGSLAAGLAAFGFGSFTDFYAAVVDPNYNTIDRNDDGVLCVKTFPVTPGRPAFLVLAIDNATISR